LFQNFRPTTSLFVTVHNTTSLGIPSANLRRFKDLCARAVPGNRILTHSYFERKPSLWQ